MNTKTIEDTLREVGKRARNIHYALPPPYPRIVDDMLAESRHMTTEALHTTHRTYNDLRGYFLYLVNRIADKSQPLGVLRSSLVSVYQYIFR